MRCKTLLSLVQLQVYPQQGSRITAPKGEQLGRTSSRGFNDPRRIKLADYNGTPDCSNPQHEPRRGWGLTLTLDEHQDFQKQLILITQVREQRLQN